MHNVSALIDSSALFSAIAGLVFSTFYPEINRIISNTKPPVYGNRKNYVRSLQNIAITKSLPLLLFLFAYLFSMAGTILHIRTGFGFSISIFLIDPVVTLFSLTYTIIFYFTICALVQFCQLSLAWWRAGSDRKITEPRISLLR